jgi:hypothetical protein
VQIHIYLHGRRDGLSSVLKPGLTPKCVTSHSLSYDSVYIEFLVISAWGTSHASTLFPEHAVIFILFLRLTFLFRMLYLAFILF